MLRFILPPLICYFSGSLMFSYWIGMIFGKDIRKVRNGNPGAYNLFKRAGFLAGVVGGTLDFLKGFIPLILLESKGFMENGIVLSISAGFAVAGHAFTPFLNFRGGKAVAVSLGCWSALTNWEAFFVLGLTLSLLSISRIKREPAPEKDSLRVIISFVLLLPYLFLKDKGNLFLFWFINISVLIIKHRREIFKILKIGGLYGNETSD
ncbi:MAG: glycerol-3-phosphate acyltransferase [Candidatus Aminicenantia bacterium]